MLVKVLFMFLQRFHWPWGFSAWVQSVCERRLEDAYLLPVKKRAKTGWMKERKMICAPLHKAISVDMRIDRGHERCAYPV